VLLDQGFTAAGIGEPGLSVFWGAYLSTADEVLISGALAEVAPEISRIRAGLRERHGWIMDTYLLRREHEGRVHEGREHGER
jgi:precorrin-6A synthase